MDSKLGEYVIGGVTKVTLFLDFQRREMYCLGLKETRNIVKPLPNGMVHAFGQVLKISPALSSEALKRIKDTRTA